MTQDPKVKLLHDFLQIADNIPPQVFLAHTAMLAVKEAQSQVSIQVQTLHDQHAAQLEQQQRDHEQRLSEHQTQYQQLLAEHAALQEQFTQQQALATHSEKDAVWIDPRTGLMWSRISIGQQWQDGQAVGMATEMNWDDAQKACKNFWLAGFDDWRLPRKEELESLMIKGQSGYNVPDGMLYPPDLSQSDALGWYWSVSSFVLNHRCAWIVDFDFGESNDDDKSSYYHVRAVRSIK